MKTDTELNMARIKHLLNVQRIRLERAYQHLKKDHSKGAKVEIWELLTIRDDLEKAIFRE